MNMHDNDIDALFRSKLDKLEVEPSAKVWGNISNELHGNKRRKTLIPILRIAASVAILIAAGMYFLPKNKKAGQTQPINRVAKNTPVKTPVTTPQTTVAPPVNGTVNTTAPMPQAAGTQMQQQLAAVPKVKTRQVATPVVNKTQPAVINPDKADAIANAQPATVLAAVNNKVIVTQPVVPDAQTSLKPVDAALETATKSTAVLAAANIPDDNGNKPATAKKHKARGFGGILNAVIGVVDKREDKIIEFTDTDEGDAVTGINLGIVKIKKQK